MSTLELLRSFTRVTELSSFTQAATSLGLPRSTVSEHVRALEALVGSRLLQRTTRRVRVTPDGLVLYERGKDMLAQADALEGLFLQDGAALHGRLRVDMSLAFTCRMVIPHLQDFVSHHPDIELEISCSDRRVDLVRDGFDCVLRIGDPTDISLAAYPLGELAIVNCASPDYLRKYGFPRTLPDLDRHRLIHYVSTLGTRPEGFEYLVDGQTRFRPMRGTVTVNNTEAYESACLAGLGLIQAPSIGMREHLRTGRLVAVLPDLLPAPMPIHLLYPHRRQLPLRVRAFMQWLSQRVEKELASAAAEPISTVPQGG